MKKHCGKAGMTLVEAILSLAIFASVLVSFGQVMRWRDSNSTQMEEALLVTELHEALNAMADDLRYSGFTADGLYPYLFEDGAADGAFALHAHAAPEAPISVGDSPSREVVFVLPADADGDGRPDMAAGGGLAWDIEDVSLVLVPDQDGMNRIERRIDGGGPRLVARHVESLVVDDSNAVGVPLGCLRLRLVLSRNVRGRRLDARGERIVRLLNGGIRP